MLKNILLYTFLLNLIVGIFLFLFTPTDLSLQQAIHFGLTLEDKFVILALVNFPIHAFSIWFSVESPILPFDKHTF